MSECLNKYFEFDRTFKVITLFTATYLSVVKTRISPLYYSWYAVLRVNYIVTCKDKKIYVCFYAISIRLKGTLIYVNKTLFSLFLKVEKAFGHHRPVNKN